VVEDFDFDLLLEGTKPRATPFRYHSRLPE